MSALSVAADLLSQAEERALRQVLRHAGRRVVVRRPLRLKLSGQPATGLELAAPAPAGAGVLVLGPPAALPGGVLVGSVPAGTVLLLEGRAHTLAADATAEGGGLTVELAPVLEADVAAGLGVTLATHSDVELRAVVGPASTSARGDWEGTRRVVELLAADLPGQLAEGDEILRAGRSLGRVVGWRRSEPWLWSPVLGSTAP